MSTNISTLVPDRVAWLKGPDSHCPILRVATRQPWRLILLGPPGVGKGTQAKLLSTRLGACHLSTGDIFRTAKHQEGESVTSAMREALEAMRQGKLVSDEMVLAILIGRTECLHCPGGFILDGFPRSVRQAKGFDAVLTTEKLKLDAAIEYQLSAEAIVARVHGRLTCPHCHAVYHQVSKPPRQAEKCDSCGTPLHQREDDCPEVSQARMQEYAQVTEPVANYYRSRGLLVSIAAAGSVEDIFHATIQALEAHAAVRGGM